MCLSQIMFYAQKDVWKQNCILLTVPVKFTLEKKKKKKKWISILDSRWSMNTMRPVQ